MKYLTHDELKQLLTVAMADSPRNHLMILVAYWHGMRATEVVKLTSRDIQDGEITVRRLKNSLKTTQQLVASEDPLFNERGIFEKLNTAGLYFPIQRQQFWRIMQRYGKLAGIAKSKCHPHIAKHTCAKLAIQKGMNLPDLKQYLGHKSLNSTGAYLAVSDQEACAGFAKAMGV